LFSEILMSRLRAPETLAGAILIALSACASAPDAHTAPPAPATTAPRAAASRPASQPASTQPASPAVLPGNGALAHPFLYAGEWDTRKPNAQSIFIVKEGKIVWQYTINIKADRGGNQEFDDATLLADGNIIYSSMAGAGMVSPDKKIVWEYKAPVGSEVHSVQSIGKDRVLLMRNGTGANPAQAMIFNTAANTLEKTVPIPTTSTSVHGQFRHIRMTATNTLLVPHMSESKVVEYDLDGKVLKTIPVPAPWSAVPLKNGNILIASNRNFVREVNPQGATVWEFTQADAPAYKLLNTQTAYRLANGNTVISNWCAGKNDYTEWPNTVQFIEVTPDKKVVWALREWKDPLDLGPSTSIQFLDEPGDPRDQQR
jgi:hypothetical protein